MFRQMLDGLDEMNWTAYGDSAELSAGIRGLASPDADTRETARSKLGTIYHQGSRYPASAPAAAFLLEVLGDPQVPDPLRVLELLTGLAIGYDSEWLPDGFPAARMRAEAVPGSELLRTGLELARSGEIDSVWDHWDSLDDDQQWDWYQAVQVAAYDTVLAGVPLFCALTRHESPQVRVAAAYALGWFPESAGTALGPLSEAAADADPAVAATALVATGLTGPAGTEAAEAMEAALADGRDIVRWGAAIGLARLRGPDAGPGTAAELLAWLGTAAPPRADIPYLEGDLAGYAGLALRHLGDAFTTAAFDALAARIPSVSGTQALNLVGEALRLAFPDGRLPPDTPFTALNDVQRRLARALADAPDVWRISFGADLLPFGNFSLLVSGYGLPGSHEDMNAYVIRARPGRSGARH